MSVGLLGAVLCRGRDKRYRSGFRHIAAGEVTEFVCCPAVAALGDSSVPWLQRAPLDPPAGDERDRQALARYLDPRTFLLGFGLCSPATRPGDGSGDWDYDEKAGPPTKASREVPHVVAPDDRRSS